MKLIYRVRDNEMNRYKDIFDDFYINQFGFLYVKDFHYKTMNVADENRYSIEYGIETEDGKKYFENDVTDIKYHAGNNWVITFHNYSFGFLIDGLFVSLSNIKNFKIIGTIHDEKFKHLKGKTK